MTELGADTPSGATGRDRWLTKGTMGIGGASLLADVGHEIPTSLLPSLLTSTLGPPAATLGRAFLAAEQKCGGSVSGRRAWHRHVTAGLGD